MTTDSAPAALDALEVFWRPGCPFCYRLLDALEGAGVAMRLHNIWDDDAARATVARLNNGNETVPTVILGEFSATNPRPKELLAKIAAEQPQLLNTAPATTSE
jgi:glutaredoxin